MRCISSCDSVTFAKATARILRRRCLTAAVSAGPSSDPSRPAKRAAWAVSARGLAAPPPEGLEEGFCL